VQRGKKEKKTSSIKIKYLAMFTMENKAKFFEKKTPQLSYVLQKNQTILKNWYNFWRKMFLATELTI